MRGLLAILFFALSAAASAAPPVYFYDMTELNALDLKDPVNARRAWDTAHLVSSVQGIVNREAPMLFVRFMPHPDDFWWAGFTGKAGWLEGRPVQRLESLEALLRRFAPQLRGVAAYTLGVHATSNLASTIAGVEDRACLRYDPAPDSVYSRVMGLGLPFTQDVTRLFREPGAPLFTGEGEIPGTDRASAGSAKCDAYLWAKHHYLDAGKCSPEYMAFYIDSFWMKHPGISGFSNATLTNHDFFIAQRAFFFDLHVWEEEAPVDDPGQRPGTDVATLKELLASMYKQAEGEIVHIGGFTPWLWKYTNEGVGVSEHGGVDSEWQYAKIISAYNGIMDADALGYSGMSNASFYQHYPLKERYPQNTPPDASELEARGWLDTSGKTAERPFFCFYMGDYDSAAWFNYHAPKWWEDPAHGETLCTWAFNPNLDRRAPHAMHFVREHQTANDWFMFGDSGAGYLNPGMLVAPRGISGVPDGLDAWVAHNGPYAERYGLSVVGFIIDGHSPGMGEAGMDAYMEFAPDGIVGQKIPVQGVHKGVMPYTRMKLDLHGSPEDAGARLAQMAGSGGPKFFFIRTILKSPSWHRGTMARARELNPEITFTDPFSFFTLLKRYEAHKEDYHDGAPAPAEVCFTAPDKEAGLRPVRPADGPFERETVDGIQVLRQAPGNQHRYLYFQVSAAFSRPFQVKPHQDAVVEVALLDRGTGRLGIHYDSHEGSSYRDGPARRLEGGGNWRTLTFPLKNASFTHGQNAGADFRLVNTGAELLVRAVRVRRAE